MKEGNKPKTAKLVQDGLREATPANAENLAQLEPYGTLPPGGIHPAARSAFQYMMDNVIHKPHRLALLTEAFGSSALVDNNDLAEICGETLRRLMDMEPVSDRYLLGLAWITRNIMESTGEI